MIAKNPEEAGWGMMHILKWHLEKIPHEAGEVMVKYIIIIVS
jgi:hypothetical protein